MRGSTIAAYIVAEAWTSLMIMLTPVPAVASPCVPAWSGQFPQGEFNGRVVATAFFDDGQGPALYAAGDFTSASGTAAKHIARWTNQGWVEVGGGLFGGTTVQVNALTVYDDGAGPALYAAGRFTTAGSVLATNIAKWNGTTWSVLTTGLDTFTYALAVYDEDGVGPGRPCLFAGGNFTTAGGTTVNKIARWDGTSWTALTSGTNFAVYALTVYNPGSGERLYAGGAFTTAGGTTVNRVASWDGTTWAALGSGANVGTGATVRALTVYDDDGPDPNAPSLIVGGDFTQAGGIGAAGVAKWNGASWSALGSGISSGSVNALAAYDDDGAGPHLPVLAMGGSFSKAGGVDVKNTARWNGSTWSAMGTLIDNVVSVLGVVDDGVSPPVLYAGGSFSTNLKYMAQWAGTDWAALGNGPGSVTETLTVTDPDGTGPQKPALYIGGWFTSAGGQPANRVAQWDGTSWSALGNGLDNTVYCLLPWDDGSGPTLYAGGNFINSGSQSVRGTATWDGTAWSPMGSGLGSSVYAMAVFDEDAAGPNPPALFAAGSFSGTPRYIARWDSTSATWSAVGSGTEINGMVLALKVYDDGSGPALYAAGGFNITAGSIANRLAKWDGSTWTTVGEGASSTIRALEVFDDDGTGPHNQALYLAGDFTMVGTTPATRIAKWDGSAFFALGSGFTGNVNALRAFDDGNGPALYAGGEFNMSGTLTVNRIAKWDGASWSALGSGITNVRGLTVFDDDDNGPVPPALYVAGSVVTAGGTSSGNMARWGCPTPPAPADFNGDGYVDVADFNLFKSCVFGPDAPLAPDCETRDLDDDNDVDQDDFARFQRCWSGSLPAVPNCAN